MAKKIAIYCSGAMHLKKKIPSVETCENIIEIFPDGEFNQRFSEGIELKGKDVFLVQSFYRNKKFSINDRIFEVLCALYTAKELGAGKVFLIAPYFPYMRQDKRFKKNQIITSKIMAKLCSRFNKVFAFEPHLHRHKKFGNYFPNAQRVTLSEFMISDIKKIKGRYKRLLIIGPDEESENWTKPVKEKLGIDYVVLKKKRLGPKHVEIKTTKKFDLDSVILIDDMISTGRTLLECLKKVTSKKIFCFAFHGLFTDKSVLKKLQDISEIYVTNTIPVNIKGIKVIDISEKIREIVEKN